MFTAAEIEEMRTFDALVDDECREAEQERRRRNAEAARRYIERHADRRREMLKRYRATHQDEIRTQQREYRKRAVEREHLRQTQYNTPLTL